MLNPDNRIKCVELQANVKLGLDDVVVTYENGETLFIQVKHTRADDTLTFGNLVSIDNSKVNIPCLESLLNHGAMKRIIIKKQKCVYLRTEEQEIERLQQEKIIVLSVLHYEDFGKICKNSL